MIASKTTLAIVMSGIFVGAGCAGKTEVVDAHYIKPDPVYDNRTVRSGGVVEPILEPAPVVAKTAPVVVKPAPKVVPKKPSPMVDDELIYAARKAAFGSANEALKVTPPPAVEKPAPVIAATVPTKPAAKAVEPKPLLPPAQPVALPEPVKPVAPPELPQLQMLTRGLVKQEATFLELRGSITPRISIDTDHRLIRFHVKEGSLQENINTLLEKTGAKLIYKTSPNHALPNSFWIESETVLGLIDVMVDPFVSPYPIEARWYQNNIVEIVYQDGKNA